MKLSEAKSVGRKIILLAFCLILFLIFTALSYGGPDPKRLKGHPEQEFLSPPNRDQHDHVLLVIIPNWNGFSLALYVKSNCAKENPTLQSLSAQEVKSKSDDNIKRAR